MSSKEQHHTPQKPPEIQQEPSDDSENMGVDDESEAEENTNTRVRTYPEAFDGPYTVYIRSLTEKVNHLTCAKYLMFKYKSLDECKRVGSHKLKAVFSDRDEANQLHLDDFFKHQKVYIPANLVEIDGLIHFPIESEIEELLANECHGINKNNKKSCEILSVFRLNAKDAKNPNNFVPSSLVRVTFAGTELPAAVKLCSLRLAVRPYVRSPMFCAKCCKFGHTRKFCSNNARCFKCNQQHETMECKGESADVCIVCNTAHEKNLGVCPQYTKRIATKNAKIQSAKKSVKRKTDESTPISNGFDGLNEEEFPAFDSTTAASHRNPSKNKSNAWADIAKEVSRPKKVPPKVSQPFSIPGFQKVKDDALTAAVVKWILKWPLSEEWKHLIVNALIPLLTKLSPFLTPLINIFSSVTSSMC